MWGHPVYVDGLTRLNEDGSGATLTATGVDAGQWVEMRTVFPRTTLSEAAPSAKHVAGDGLSKILADERVGHCG